MHTLLRMRLSAGPKSAGRAAAATLVSCGSSRWLTGLPAFARKDRADRDGEQTDLTEAMAIAEMEQQAASRLAPRLWVGASARFALLIHRLLCRV